MNATGDLPDAGRPLTAQQARALERGVSIGLSAGAGCGKTFVLTQRFLSHLGPAEEGCDLSQLVAITFTDRAAREMRDRIREECRSRLLSCTDNEADHWQNLLRQLDAARVSTIHSFCGSLLRANAVEAGLDPAFTLLDETTAAAFLRRSVEQALSARLAGRDADALALVFEFGLEKTRTLLEQLVGERYRIDFRIWRDRPSDELAALWEKLWRTEAVPKLVAELISSPPAALALRLLEQHEPTHPVMQARRKVLLGLLSQTAANATDASAFLKRLREHAQVQGGGSARFWPDPEIYLAVRDVLAVLRGRIDRVLKILECHPTHTRAAAESGLAALRLVETVGADYDRLKRAEASLDFDDLLLAARDLLRDHPAVCRRASAAISLLMVDEFQDTDPIQTEIVRLLCGDELPDGKLFLVGDVKQSIYRFRRAAPQVFLELRGALPAAGRLPLSINFRSQPAILNFVNALFDGALGDEYEALTAPEGARQLSPEPCVEFLFSTSHADLSGPDRSGADPPQADDESADDESADDESADQRRRREADRIARRLKSLLTDGVGRVRENGADGPVLRPAELRDIVILFRAMTDVRLYEDALRRYGLDYYVVGGQAFYSQQEIFDVVNLCRCLDDPDDEIALMGVLRSPFFSLSDDALFALAQPPALAASPAREVQKTLFAEPGAADEARPPGERDEDSSHARLPLFAALQQPPPAWLAEEQRERIAFAAAILSELRKGKDRWPLARLLTMAVDRTGYDAALLTEFLGHRKLANLRKLIDLARDFDQTGLFTLADYVGQMQDAVGEEIRESLAATHPESSNVIRLMSIHQSKGLEFPVVVVADLDRQGNDPSPAARFDPHLGPLVRLPPKFGEERDNLGLRLLRVQEKSEVLAETLRLLYVATTRAADHLILSANLVAPGKVSHPWLKLLSERFDLFTGQPRTTPATGGVSVLAKYAGRLPQILVHQKPPELAGPETSSHNRLVSLAALRDSVRMAEPLDVPATVAPVPPDSASRRRFTVSEIEREDAALRGTAPPITEPARPDEAGETPATAADTASLVGRLVHSVLERIDFGAPAPWRALLEALVQGQTLPLENSIVDEAAACVAALIDAPLSHELAAARRLYREIAFLLAWPPARSSPVVSDSASCVADLGPVLPPDPYGRERLIAGTLDCLCLNSAGAWMIVDYKTGRVAPSGADGAFLAQHEIQLALYSLAAQQFLGRWPDRVELVLLRDKARRVAFDPQAADWQSLLLRISRAIHSLAGAPAQADAQGHFQPV
ncbi:MAG: UvrD-helicase domain-containing protein [Planctomycetaceae bacterium]